MPKSRLRGRNTLDKEIKHQTIDQMVDEIMKLPERTKFQLLAPVVRGKKGTHAKVFEKAKKSGYVRAIVDGNQYDLSEDIELDKNIKHNIEIVVDRLVMKEGIESRLTDSIENVMKLAEGTMILDVIGGEPMNFSQSYACADCGISIDEIEPRSFSFNNPFGACPVCHGIGIRMEFSEALIIPDDSLSISEGAIAVTGWQSATDPSSYTGSILTALAKEFKFSLDTPYKKLSKEVRHMLIYGTDRCVKVHYRGQRGVGVYDIVFEGILANVRRRYRETSSEYIRQEYESFMEISPCEECGGKRLKKESLAVTVGDKNIAEVTEFSIGALQNYLDTLELTEQQQMIGKLVLKHRIPKVRPVRRSLSFPAIELQDCGRQCMIPSTCP